MGSSTPTAKHCVAEDDGCGATTNNLTECASSFNTPPKQVTALLSSDARQNSCLGNEIAVSPQKKKSSRKAVLAVIIVCFLLVALGLAVVFTHDSDRFAETGTQQAKAAILDRDSAKGNSSGILADGGISVIADDGCFIATADSIVFQRYDQVGTDEFVVVYDGTAAYLNYIGGKLVFVADVNDFAGVLKGTRILAATVDSETHELTSEPDVMYSASNDGVVSANSRIHDLYCCDGMAYFIEDAFDLADICAFSIDKSGDTSSVSGFESDNRLLDVDNGCAKVLTRSTDDMGSYDGWAYIQVDLSEGSLEAVDEFNGILVADGRIAAAAFHDGELYCCEEGGGSLFQLSLQGSRSEFQQVRSAIHITASNDMLAVITAAGDIGAVSLDSGLIYSLKDVLADANLYFVPSSSHLGVYGDWLIIRDPLGGLFQVNTRTETAVALCGIQ